MSKLDFSKFVKNRLASLLSFDNAGTDLSGNNAQDTIVELAARHFGKDALLKEKNDSETVTGSNFLPYDSASFNANGATNRYLLAAFCLYGHRSASNDIRFRLNLNNGSKIVEARVEPKDAGSDQRIPGMILFEGANLSQGVNNISLEYRPASASKVSRMYFSLIFAWRIS